MPQHKDWIAVLFLVALVLAVFWRATLGGIFYFGDILQLHYPLRSAYTQELTRFSLPLWTPHVLAGYPLLAEGQVGALYPPNMILHFLLPVPIALNIFILGHFVLAATAAYAFARRLGACRTAALCSGLVYALGGFLVAHLNHVNIVACAAWLPWLFLLTDRLFTDKVFSPKHIRTAALLTLTIGLELLAGHAQVALLTLLAVVAYALYLTLIFKTRGRALAIFVLSLLLGVAIAAAQLLPSYELAQLSTRAGGLAPTFFASFSLHPFYLISLLAPFVLGNPYPSTSVEWVGYAGWLPLLLALLAPLVTRRSLEPRPQVVRKVRFFVALAAIALLLALGRWNPAYMALLHLPLFNLFRVPARYLYLFSFSTAMLAGLGLDALLIQKRGLACVAEDMRGWLLVAIAALLTLLAISQVSAVNDLVALWRWLPIILGLLSLSWLVLTWQNRGASSLLATLALVLVVVDLIAFNAVYSRTYNQTMPMEEFTASPRSLSFFRSQAGIYRIYTYERIVPALPVMRESYYPNLSLVYGLSAINGLFPLVPERYACYVEQMTPRMLDLLGVRYFLIPQLLPVDEASELYDVDDPFVLNPVGRSVSIPPTRAAMVEIESYLSHSVDWLDGQAVAEIKLRGEEGQQETITLRAGWHTAEWAYDRSDVSTHVRHRQPAIARSWPARSGFPPEDHTGYVYRASFRLSAPLTIQTVEVQPLVPSAYVRIERLILVDEVGTRYQLSHLLHMGDHTLTYRSEDVAIYLNHDALPRTFITHSAQAVPDDAEALRILHEPGFDPRTKVLLAVEQVTEDHSVAEETDEVELLTYDANRVVIKVHAAADGYLVLTDAWYPCWRAYIDGQEVPVLRADLIFRAVRISAGRHLIEFTYAPQSFRAGLWASAAALLLLSGLGVWGWTGKR